MSRGIKYGSYLKMLVIRLKANTHRAMKERKQITEHKIRWLALETTFTFTASPPIPSPHLRDIVPKHKADGIAALLKAFQQLHLQKDHVPHRGFIDHARLGLCSPLGSHFSSPSFLAGPACVPGSLHRSHRIRGQGSGASPSSRASFPACPSTRPVPAAWDIYAHTAPCWLLGILRVSA